MKSFEKAATAQSENTHRSLGKGHCTAGIQFYKTRTDLTKDNMLLSVCCEVQCTAVR